MPASKTRIKAIEKVSNTLSPVKGDARKRSIRKRDAITGQIVANETFELEEDAYKYLLEKTDNGKEIVDIGLRWLRSRSTKNKKAVADTVKAQIWRAFYDALSKGDNKGSGGEVNITQYIFNLESKIKERGAEIINVNPITDEGE